MDWTALNEVLTWIVGGGGAAMLAYWLMTYIPALKQLEGEVKRYVAFALAALLGIGAWALLGWLTGEPWPETAQLWVTVLFRVAALAIIGSQIAHARKDLPRRA